ARTRGRAGTGAGTRTRTRAGRRTRTRRRAAVILVAVARAAVLVTKAARALSTVRGTGADTACAVARAAVRAAPADRAKRLALGTPGGHIGARAQEAHARAALGVVGAILADEEAACRRARIRARGLHRADVLVGVAPARAAGAMLGVARGSVRATLAAGAR